MATKHKRVQVYPTPGAAAVLGQRSKDLNAHLEVWATVLHKRMEELAERIEAADWELFSFVVRSRLRDRQVKFGVDPKDVLRTAIDACWELQDISDADGVARARRILDEADAIGAWAIWLLAAQKTQFKSRDGKAWWTVGYRLEKNFPGCRCGSLMVIRDGKYVCPDCGVS